MKRKIFSILFALVLVLSLGLVTAVPVAADPGDVELTIVGNATAEYSIEEAYSLDYSVKLYVLDGVADWAEVSIPVDIPLKDIAEVEFWEYVESYSPNGYSVNVMLGVDCDGDGVFRADVPAWHQGNTMHTLAVLNGDSFVQMDGVSANPATGVWTETNALSVAQWWTPDNGTGVKNPLGFAESALYPSTFYGAFADFVGLFLTDPTQTSLIPNDDARVLCVKLLIGGSGSWMNETAYVDDITINGVPYPLEPPSGAVDMTATYPAPVLGISVSPASVSFGDIEPGEESVAGPIIITNTGTVAENFSAALINISTPDVYTAGLKIADTGTPPGVVVSTWEKLDVPKQTPVEDQALILTVPEGIPYGTYTATLVFWAEIATTP